MIVMKNIFSANLRVHKKYDLKGVETRESSDKNLALKDCDFLKDQVRNIASIVYDLKKFMPRTPAIRSCFGPIGL